MSQKSYPREMPPQWLYTHNRPGIKVCDKCGQQFPKPSRICVIETQVNWFRGDDEVTALCEPCAKLAGHTPPPSKAEKQLVNLQNHRKALAAQVAVLKPGKELRKAILCLSGVERRLAELEKTK